MMIFGVVGSSPETAIKRNPTVLGGSPENTGPVQDIGIVIPLVDERSEITGLGIAIVEVTQIAVVLGADRTQDVGGDIHHGNAEQARLPGLVVHSAILLTIEFPMRQPVFLRIGRPTEIGRVQNPQDLLVKEYLPLQ